MNVAQNNGKHTNLSFHLMVPIDTPLGLYILDIFLFKALHLTDLTAEVSHLDLRMVMKSWIVHFLRLVTAWYPIIQVLINWPIIQKKTQSISMIYITPMVSSVMHVGGFPKLSWNKSAKSPKVHVSYVSTLNNICAIVPWSKVDILGVVIQSLIGNPYNGYLDPRSGWNF